MELDFFTGYHGSGKTYTANELLDQFDASLADTGPIIRSEFQKSRISDFGLWNKEMEYNLGPEYSNIIVINGINEIIQVRKPEHLFVVGNRDIDGVGYIKRNLENDGDKILFFNRPFDILKSGYELRTGKKLTDDEFCLILKDDENRGLLRILEYIYNHPENCSIIESDTYDDESIDRAFDFINKPIDR